MAEWLPPERGDGLRPQTSVRARTSGGVPGGTSPLARPQWCSTLRGLACLGPVTGPKPALRTPLKASPGTARNRGHPTVPGKLPGLSAVCLEDGDGDGRPVTLWRRRARCRAPLCPPTPYPSETGDRRSGAIPRPVSTPKCALAGLRRPLSPSRRRRPIAALRNRTTPA